jgi:hypothetical protein
VSTLTSLNIVKPVRIMPKENVQQNEDELIADFIGKRLPKSSYCDGNQWTFKFCEGYYPTLKTMKFQTSWDWLMPVWIKINTDVANWEGCYLFMTQQGWWKKGVEHGFGMGDIDIAYDAVLKGIKWYNEYKDETSSKRTSREDSNLDGSRKDSSRPS